LANQSLYEFWSVVTRPVSSNGFDLTPAEASTEIEQFRQDFLVVGERDDLFDRWLTLCTTYGIRGRPSHDARLVAAADVFGILQLLTLAASHFARFAHLQVITP
jgi:hypothetical protein